MRERVRRAPCIFEGVGQIVMRGEVSRHELERALEVRHRRQRASLPAVGRVWRLRYAPQQQELDVFGIRGHGPVEGRTIRHQPRRVSPVRLGRHLERARFDVRAIVGRRGLADRLCAFDGRSRQGRLVQLGEGHAQSHMGHRQRGVDPERLVERTRRFHPEIRMQVGQPLVVKGLGVLRRSGHGVVSAADPLAKGHRAIEDLVRNAGNPVQGVLGGTRRP